MQSHNHHSPVTFSHSLSGQRTSVTQLCFWNGAMGRREGTRWFETKEVVHQLCPKKLNLHQSLIFLRNFVGRHREGGVRQSLNYSANLRMFP